MATWPEEVLTFSQGLWREGKSAAEISKAIRDTYKLHFSRSAVMGKMHRTGVAKTHSHLGAIRGPKPRIPRPPPKPRPPKAAVLPAPSGPPQKRAAEPPPRIELTPTATVMTITAFGCRWPIGDPAEDDFGFCGRRAHGPYCATHAALAWDKSRASRRHSGDELIRGLRRYL